MAKNDNLQDFLTDIANSIRTKTGTTEQINAQDFSDKILSIPSGGGNTLKNLLDTTKSSQYLFEACTEISVDNLIQPNDTENVKNMDNMFGRSWIQHAPQLNTSKATKMSYMFYHCDGIKTIPQYDTSNVTDMEDMFYHCSKLTEIPLLNTSNVTTMSSMFYHCASLTTIPKLNTSNVDNTTYMFNSCKSLTSIPKLDTSKVTNMGSMFTSCTNLTTIPQLETRKVTNMYNMFNSCSNLTEIPQLDVYYVTNMNNMFGNCPKLKSILMTNIGANLDISSSTEFERSDLLIILNNLKTVTSSKTLTMKETNLAKLTEEDKAIAINKGWTLA